MTSGDDLQPIGATAIYPLPLYSAKYDDPSKLPAKAKVAIPNDAVNEARGLLVLQSAGLVTLKDGGTAFSTTKDIESAKIEVQPVDASQTATAVKNGSVAAAIVNKNYAVDAKLPKDQIIAQDDPSSAGAEPYVNAFVARKADAKDPLLLKLAALYHTPPSRTRCSGRTAARRSSRPGAPPSCSRSSRRSRPTRRPRSSSITRGGPPGDGRATRMEGGPVVASVRIESVSKTYGAVRAVDDVSLTVERGSIVGVIGYSGAGKSTLVRLINGLERPSAGRVFVGDDEITALTERQLLAVRRGIGMIFQQFNLFRSRTVAGTSPTPSASRASRSPSGTPGWRGCSTSWACSTRRTPTRAAVGGQKQRVGIARALATDPHLLLADEATSALDPETTADVLALLRRVNQELGVTIVLITHEMEAVRAIADRVVVMDGGRVVEQGPLYDVFAAPSSPAAARFVRGVLHDRPSTAVLQRIRAAHDGRIITVAVTDRPGLVAAVARALTGNGVEAELVHGGIGELGGPLHRRAHLRARRPRRRRRCGPDRPARRGPRVPGGGLRRGRLPRQHPRVPDRDRADPLHRRDLDDRLGRPRLVLGVALAVTRRAACSRARPSTRC